VQFIIHETGLIGWFERSDDGQDRLDAEFKYEMQQRKNGKIRGQKNRIKSRI
jgi:hypothetical protein